MSVAKGLYCQRCKAVIPESDIKIACPDCNEPLDVCYDLAEMKKLLEKGTPSSVPESFLKRWAHILPIDNLDLIEKVSLGEGQTPLLRSSRVGGILGVTDLRFKLEMGPSLSLKDRGTVLCALKALELGYNTLCVASSGNNASSVAAYAAKAGLGSVVFVQKNASAAKIFKCLIYGAHVVRVDGDMATASQLCKEVLKRHRWMQAGAPNPYRLTAKRTAAYEIVRQMGGRAPDAVLVPCGTATAMLAVSNGFFEMAEMGLIPVMPKMIGVQLTACDPITRAYEEGRDRITPVEKKPSFSDALMNNTPYWGTRALRAARQSGGFFISVSDQEVADSIRLLGAKEGLFTEPAGAVSLAGLRRALAEKRLPKLRSAVCMLTGHGLNAPKAAFDSSELPEIVAPEVDRVEAYLGL